MQFSLILEWAIKSFVIIISLTVGFAYMTWYERRLLARFQVRRGPNRAGPFGLLQPVADGLKLFFKEELIPKTADKFIFLLAPVITVIPALIVTAVVPWGDTVKLFGNDFSLGLADLNVGVLYILTVTSISVYGITLAGWSSNNKYATLGGLRAVSQMMSYELSLGLAYLGPVMVAGSLSLMEIVRAQQPVWFIFVQPVAFIIYFIASLAEVNRAPFDMPEAEQELTAGYLTEYSGMKFGMFFVGEYLGITLISAFVTVLFFGGWLGPVLPPLVWFLIKMFACICFFILVRATLPRLRYDQLLSFGWKVMLPLALLNLVVTGGVVVARGG